MFISVQPMSSPISLKFYLDMIYGKKEPDMEIDIFVWDFMEENGYELINELDRYSDEENPHLRSGWIKALIFQKACSIIRVYFPGPDRPVHLIQIVPYKTTFSPHRPIVQLGWATIIDLHDPESFRAILDCFKTAEPIIRWEKSKRK